MNKNVIGIIGAMKTEIDALKDKLQSPVKETISGIEFVSGKLEGKDVVVAVCGVGKVFAAICAQTMIIKYSPCVVINIGVGGALSKELNIGDAVIAENVVQHDMDTSAVGDPVGLISGINIVNIPCSKTIGNEIIKAAEGLGIGYKTGTIATGDVFLVDPVRKQFVSDEFKALVAEMEGGAIGHVCYVNNVECCILRTISDKGDEHAGEDYMKYKDSSAASAIKIATEFVKNHNF